jgi:hypothetical protein
MRHPKPKPVCYKMKEYQIPKCIQEQVEVSLVDQLGVISEQIEALHLGQDNEEFLISVTNADAIESG